MVRLKQRYIVVAVSCVANLSDNAIINCLRTQVQHLHGDYGAALIQLSLRVIYYNRYTRTAIVRVKRGLQNLLMQAMALVSQIKTTDVSFRTLHVAGSLRSCRKFLITYYHGHKPFLLGGQAFNNGSREDLNRQGPVHRSVVQR